MKDSIKYERGVLEIKKNKSLKKYCKWKWEWEMRMRNENEKWKIRIKLWINKKYFLISCQIDI